MLSLRAVLLSYLVSLRALSACHADCVTCQTPSANKCNSCGANAHLDSPAPGRCLCNSGSFTTTDTQHCTGVCSSTCLTCTAAGSSNCSSCKSNASLSGTTCVCNSGYVGSAASCVSCDSTCLTCSASGPSGCTSCKPGAIQATAGVTFACICDISFFPDPSAANCSACNVQCLACVASGPTNCSGCKGAAHLSSPSVSVCVCDSTYFPSPTVANCVSCHIACGDCNGPLSSNCLTCPTDAYLPLSPPSTCVCSPSFFSLSDASACLPCHPTCATCSNSLNTDCSSCKSGAVFDSSTPKLCVCGLGYDPTPDARNCVKSAVSCDASCLLCSVINSPTDCSSCYLNAYLTAGNSCVCLSYAFPDPDVANCKLCHATCAACVTSASANSCTQCYTNAHLSIGSPSACECDSGFYPSSDSSNCQVCNPLCDTCEGPKAEQCFSCKSFAVLSDTPPSSCTCENGYYPNPDVGSCSSCDSSCELCLSAGASGCSKCKPGAFLSGSAPNSCTCGPGFYPLPTPGTCTQCSIECLTCSSASECLSCRENTVLISGKCVCGERAYHDSVSSNCVNCSEGCKACLSIGCLTCDDEWNFLNSECYQPCPSGFISMSGFCLPIDTSPPIPSLISDANNTLHIDFDRDMRFSLLSSDISIEIADNASNIYEAVWPDPVVTSLREISIPLKFNVTYMPATTANLTFLYPDKVTDINGISIKDSVLSVKLQPFGSINNSSQIAAAVSRATQATVSATLSTSLSSSFISGQYASLWKVLNQIQIVSYIPMGATPIPDTLKQTLLALNMITPFSDQIAYVFTEDSDCFTVVEFANDYSISSVSFFASTNMMLMAFLSLAFLHTSACYLSKSKSVAISSVSKRVHAYFTWGVPLRWWIQCYLDIGILGMLQIYNFPMLRCFAFPKFATSAVFAVAFVALFFITPILTLIFTVKTYRLMAARTDEKFNSRWGLLFMQFKETATAGNLAFYVIFFVRRMVFGVITVGLQSFPTLQAVLNSAGSLVPFIKRMDQFNALIDEFSTFILFSACVLFNFNLGIAATQHIEAICIVTIMAGIGLSAAVSSLEMVITIGKYLKEYKEKAKSRGDRKRYQPDTNESSAQQLQGEHLRVEIET